MKKYVENSIGCCKTTFFLLPLPKQMLKKINFFQNFSRQGDPSPYQVFFTPPLHRVKHFEMRHRHTDFGQSMTKKCIHMPKSESHTKRCLKNQKVRQTLLCWQKVTYIFCFSSTYTLLNAVSQVTHLSTHFFVK